MTLESPHPRHGFYGFDWGTYYVSPRARIWLIQSDDLDASQLPKETEYLPVGGDWLEGIDVALLDFVRLHNLNEQP